MQLNETFTINAPIAQVWQALTDATVIEHWTTGPAHMDPKAGGKFSIYDGDVHGITTECVPEQLLRQDWQGDDHPDRTYDVTFRFHAPDAQTTTVTVVHTASRDDYDSMRDGWQEYYFKPLKQLLEKQATSQTHLVLTGKKHVTGNVWTFSFASSQPLSWIAGQYIWVELLHDRPDAKGARRWFTISSAPYEGEIRITTRVSDSTFKRALAALPMGGELRLLEKPDGDFIWHDSGDLPMVFVAGGIGITAFHSMLAQRVYDDAPIAVTLLYGSRDEHIPFREELDQWAAQHPEFSVRYITGAQLSAEHLIEIHPGITASLLYISGPEAMVKALGEALLARGLPQSQLRLDALPNYTDRNY